MLVFKGALQMAQGKDEDIVAWGFCVPLSGGWWCCCLVLVSVACVRVDERLNPKRKDSKPYQCFEHRE